MRIIFNLMQCGLGNQGGSKTIVESANELHKLGHEVTIIDTGKNHHTWTPLNVPHKKIRSYNNIPDADIVIATGFNTAKSTVRIPKRCGIKVHWIRGFELWNMTKRQIIKDVLEVPINKMVNGKGLQTKLKQLGFESKIIRPGYNIDAFSELKIRNKTNEITILGGLYNSGKKRSTKRVKWIIDAVEQLRKKYRIELWMMGTEPKPFGKIIDKYFHQPDLKAKNTFYNYINLWLAPTCLEGLHIPPAEAMLTGCPVLCTNAPLGGMQDYMIGGETGIVTENNFDSFYNGIEHLLKNQNEMFAYGGVARRSVLKLGTREDNMKKMVEHFESLINKK